MAAVEIIAIARRLDQLSELPKDAPKSVLKGLQKVTHNNDFKHTFNLIGNFQGQSVISFSGSTSTASPLELIEMYFEQAKTLYTSALCLGTNGLVESLITTERAMWRPIL